MITTLTPMQAFKLAREFNLDNITRWAIQDSREFQMSNRPSLAMREMAIEKEIRLQEAAIKSGFAVS